MVGHALGAVLALALGGLVLASLFVAWRRPCLALPILVAGMAAHNAFLMLLLAAGVPDLVVRCLQTWKEAVLALLAIRLLYGLVRSGLRPALATAIKSWRSSLLVVRLLDLAVVVFATMLLVYTVVPMAASDSQASLTQRLFELRTLGLIPLLYLFGRVWPPASLRLGLGLVAAVAVMVVIVGLVELWFIPTRAWLDLGILKFDSWLGYHYSGPLGLPENFFDGTSAGLLRRMVSSYLSPLGVAYTSILVIPVVFIASVSSPRRDRRYAWLGLILILVGMGLSLTRLALLCMAVEAIVLVALRLRRSGFLAAGFIAAAIAFGLLVYPAFGPIVSTDLTDIRPPLGAQILSFGGGGGGGGGYVPNVTGEVVNQLTTGNDSSIQAHVEAVKSGIRFVAEHPLGVGLGTSVARYGTASGPAESALFAIGADIGLLGLLLFMALYGGLVLAGLAIAWSRREDVAKCALGAVVGVGGLALAPVVLTSQVWGDFSVTFLFWWAAGSVVTVLANDAVWRSRKDSKDGSASSEQRDGGD